MSGRPLRTAAAALALSLAFPAGALAHGVQGRADTPIPVSAFFWTAAIVLVVSFAGLAVGWSRPLLTAYAWRRAPAWLERVVLARVTILAGRALVLGAFLFVWAAAALGSTRLGANVAPLVVFVVWWAGLVPVSALLGNVWRELNPWASLARLLRLPEERPERPYPRRLGWWPAAVLLLAFGWLELVYPTPASPRMIAVVVGLYTLAMLAGMWRWGIRAWLDHGEAFAVYTGLLAHLSAVEVREGPEGRALGFRPPVVAVTHLPARAALVGFIAVIIGTVTFDGLSGSDVWTTRDVAASERLINLGVGDFTAGVIVATVGLVGSLLVVLVLFEGTSWVSARAARWPNMTSIGRVAVAYAHSLVPIALAYFVAHYFTLFVFQSQDLIRLASDPFGRGADWFGTAGHAIDFQLVSPNVIWAVQVTAIVVGHVVALALAHDRALELANRPSEALRSQWPMLVLMVLLTVSGLWSLSEGMATV